MGGKVSFIYKAKGKSIMLMVLSLLGATGPAPEQDPDPPQEPVPTTILSPAASLEPELAHPVPAAVAQQSRRAVTSPVLLGPVEVVVRALIHAPGMEEPAASLPELEVQQCPAPDPGVPEWPESPAASAEQPASSPEQQLVQAAAPNNAFPSPVIAFFVIFLIYIHLYNDLIDFFH